MLHADAKSQLPFPLEFLPARFSGKIAGSRRCTIWGSLILTAMLTLPVESVSAQIPRRPGRPSTVDIGNKFLREKAKDRKEVIDALEKQKKEASKFLEASTPELANLQQAASQLETRRNEIGKLVSEDGDKVGAAKRNAREVEEKVLSSEPENSAYKKALAELNQRVAEEDLAAAAALSVPPSQPKNRQELQTSLGKLTSEQKKVLEKNQSYQDAKRRTQEALDVETNARRPVLNKSPEVAAAKEAITSAEAALKKSKSEQVIAVRELNRASGLAKGMQAKISAAMVTIANAETEIAKLNAQK